MTDAWVERYRKVGMKPEGLNLESRNRSESSIPTPPGHPRFKIVDSRLAEEVVQ